MWGKKKAVEEPVEVDEVFDDLHAELDDIVEAAEQPEAEVPEDFEARVNELTVLLREAQERAAQAKTAVKPEGLSPFKTPFESKPAAVVERPRSLNRRITRVEVEAGESRIVSQFEDNEPEDKKVYPAVWNLGYRLEELAAAVANLIGQGDTHYHEEYAGKIHSHDLSHEHDFPGGVIVSDEEPQPEEPDEEIAEGTLWYDTDRLEMFIFYDGGWITTTALSARVEAGEAIQRDLVARVAAGEAAQAILQEAITAKADADHDHDPPDLAHDHDGTYSLEGHTHDEPDLAHDHDADYLKNSGEQTLDEGNWKVRKPNNQGGKYTYIEIDNDEMGLYHVKDPTNAVHAANKKYVDDNTSLGRPFVYGNSDLAGHFTMANAHTSVYLNKTDANGRTRRHRHAPDFNWNTELKYTIWDENGVLVHAGLTSHATDYSDDKLQFKNCRALYDMGLVTDTLYYINLEGYW